MRRSSAIVIAAGMMLTQPVAALAQAPTWSAQQQAVWAVVSRSWSDEVARNGRWPGEYVHRNVVGWGAQWPMPRYRESIERWTRWSDQTGQTMQYEISPASITIAGDTAVVNYSAVTVRQRQVGGTASEEAPERDVEGISETLVRDGGQWRFLSTTSFPLGGGGDD